MDISSRSVPTVRGCALIGIDAAEDGPGRRVEHRKCRIGRANPTLVIVQNCRSAYDGLASRTDPATVDDVTTPPQGPGLHREALVNATSPLRQRSGEPRGPDLRRAGDCTSLQTAAASPTEVSRDDRQSSRPHGCAIDPRLGEYEGANNQSSNRVRRRMSHSRRASDLPEWRLLEEVAPVAADRL